MTVVSWNRVEQPGAYVELETGSLVRIPREALSETGSPLIRKESGEASLLVQISADPHIATLKARMLCAERNIPPSF